MFLLWGGGRGGAVLVHKNQVLDIQRDTYDFFTMHWKSVCHNEVTMA